MRPTWRVLAVAALAVAPLLGAGPASAASAAPGRGEVFVVQAIPGARLDVVVDGSVVATAAPSATVVGPLELTPGEHALELRDGASVAATASFTVAGGATLDVVAHLQADQEAAPRVTTFPDDLRAVAPGKGRLAVAHTAALPPVDLVVDGTVLARTVANGEAWSGPVPATTLALQAVPSATGGDPVLGPVDVRVAAGTLTRVYVVGTAGAATTVVHTVPVPVSGAAPPRSVQTGDGGQAATRLLDDPAAVGAAGAGALAAALGATLAFGRRSRRTAPAAPDRARR